MAKSYLTSNQFQASQDPFGLAAQAIAGSAPALYNPYGSTGSNIGTALGSALLAGLLGGIANNRTESRNDELFKLGTSLYDMTPAQRTALLESNPDYRRRLSPLAEALQEREVEQRLKSQGKYEDALQEQYAKLGQVRSPSGQIVEVLDPVKQESKEAYEIAKSKTLAEYDAKVGRPGYDPLKDPDSDESKAQSALFDKTSKLRTEYLSPNYSDAKKNLERSLIGFRSLVEAAKDTSGMADVELVKGGIQAIEPGMAVQGKEGDAIAESQSIPNWLKGVMVQALSGGPRLDDEARAAILRIAGRRYDSYRKAVADHRGLYQGLAEQEGVDPAKVVLGGLPPEVNQIYPDFKKADTIASRRAALEARKQELLAKKALNRTMGGM